jgi:hypothetical protein
VDRDWLQRERARGNDALRQIAAQRPQLLTDTHGLGRFAIRMAIVDVTGSVAGWAAAVHAGLLAAGEVNAAAAFSDGPPFAGAAPTPEDCDRLSEYVLVRVSVLEELLRASGP